MLVQCSVLSLDVNVWERFWSNSLRQSQRVITTSNIYVLSVSTYIIYILLLIAAMIIINCLLEHFIKVLSLCLSKKGKRAHSFGGRTKMRGPEVMRISCCVDLLSVFVNVYMSHLLIKS